MFRTLKKKSLLVLVLLVPGLVGSFLVLGAHKFEPLPVYQSLVDEPKIAQLFPEKEFWFHTTLWLFPENTTDLDGVLFRVRNYIEERVDDYPYFQYAIPYTKSMVKNMANFTKEYPTDQWKFIPMPDSTYRNLKSNLIQILSPHNPIDNFGFITDIHGKIRSGKNKNPTTKEVTFVPWLNLSLTSEIRKRMLDDILLLESERRLAFKKNKHIYADKRIEIKEK